VVIRGNDEAHESVGEVGQKEDKARKKNRDCGGAIKKTRGKKPTAWPRKAIEGKRQQPGGKKERKWEKKLCQIRLQGWLKKSRGKKTIEGEKVLIVSSERKGPLNWERGVKKKKKRQGVEAARTGGGIIIETPSQKKNPRGPLNGEKG